MYFITEKETKANTTDTGKREDVFLPFYIA